MQDELNGKPRYAFIKHPIIAAVANELFRFADEEQAKRKMQSIEDMFITSRHTAPDPTVNTHILWVRGWEVSEEEKAQGFLGHYAILSVKPREKKGYTLCFTKLASELKTHPEKRREVRPHPDWGHPTLRAARNKRVYESEEDAFNDLMRLHEHYPEISTPGLNSLIIPIYYKGKNDDNPVKRHKLLIRRQGPNAYIIEAKLQEKTAPGKKKTAPKGDVKGKFTAMTKHTRRIRTGGAAIAKKKEAVPNQAGEGE
jgi:hypothetical protein